MSSPTPAKPVMTEVKKTGLVSTVLKGLKTVVVGFVVLLMLWMAYSFGSKALSKYFKSEVPIEAPKTFELTDSVSYVPQLGLVNEINSDKTVDAILSGSLGPAVVLFHAEWCGHCKNMEFAYSAAAKTSTVPFVKVNGPSAPVSSSKYGVSGYPTMFGVSSLGLLNKYTNARTTEAFLQFTKLLVPEAKEGPIVTSMPSLTPQFQAQQMQPMPQQMPQMQQQMPQMSQMPQQMPQQIQAS